MEQLPSLAFMSSASSFFAYGDAWSTILWITSLTFVLFIVAPSVCWVWNRLKKNNRKTRFFYYSIAAVAIIGATWSFLLPIAIDSGFRKDDDGPVLRQILLYATGGLLGVMTLGETHRRNNQEKEKNENDHTRQVYAERRSRYTKAVEQLANEKAAVRLGGIYTLVGLVDEWLTDDTLLNPKERQKEGQVIINNLCSYIRSPFPLAAKIEEYEARKELEKLQKSESGKLSEEESLRLQVLLKRFEDSDEYEKPKDITTDYAKFHAEQDVRCTIFVEMSKRSSTFPKNDEGEIIETVPGPWSDFDFDFSRAPIFYPLSAITIEKGNFSSAKFYSNADFSRATFTQTADFRWTAFAQTAYFSGATFTQTADFSWTAFTQDADFSGATFTQTANFSWAIFTQNAYFSRATFTQNAYFSGATFTQTAYFYGATFTQDAYFSGATFTQDADFSRATFTQTAYFSGATFTQDADFSRATFTQDADFSRATFTQNADFSEATFSASSPKFVEISKALELTFRARFATLPKNQRADSFTVSEGSFPILLGEAELGDGIKHHIPVGTVLFDPSSEETSEPAKPLDKSNDGEEEKPE